jgi:ABC-type uncharacterized transport system involved in gliding motility auxiliary subunit
MTVLLAIFGIVLILFGIVGLFAAPLWLAATHLGIGAAFLVVAAFRGLGDFRTFLTRDSTRRGIRYGGNALLQTVAITIILALVAYLSVRHSVRWDWTEAQVHSLTDATHEVLAQIPEDEIIEILAFYLPGGPPARRAALDLYSHASDRVNVTTHSPIKRPDLAERFEIRSEGVLIVCRGPCAAATSTVRITEPSEQELTKAVRSVISQRRKVVFLTGHGEGDPANEEANGFLQAKRALEDENIEVSGLLLANLEEVPEGTDAVIIAGPDHSLLQRELDALDIYLRNGGSLLVMAEPIVVSNLEERVAEWGIELGSDIVVDQQIQLFAGPQLGVQPIITDYGAHIITDELAARRSPTLFQLARSVRAVDGDAAGEVVELVRTGRASWAETDVDLFVDEGRVSLDYGRDRQGPVALAVAREFPAPSEDARGGRLVVVGDADFARNRYIAEFYNVDLFLNIVNWLVGEEQFISIERKRPRASSVVMTAQQVSTFRYLSIFVLPELILLLGILNWWVRRT